VDIKFTTRQVLAWGLSYQVQCNVQNCETVAKGFLVMEDIDDEHPNRKIIRQSLLEEGWEECEADEGGSDWYCPSCMGAMELEAENWEKKDDPDDLTPGQRRKVKGEIDKDDAQIRDEQELKPESNEV